MRAQGQAVFTRSADRLHGIFAWTHESPGGKEAAMVASMVGLGPHEMTGWLWVFSIGLTISLALLAALSFFVAWRMTGRLEQSGR